jgi:hypothetical protein
VRDTEQPRNGPGEPSEPPRPPDIEPLTLGARLETSRRDHCVVAVVSGAGAVVRTGRRGMTQTETAKSRHVRFTDARDRAEAGGP